MIRVEIIAVGKEILRGQTLDTNSSWLAKRITALGGAIGRIVIPDDDVEAIAQEIKISLQNKAQIIITTGGLGPTFDDMTLGGIAEATGRPLALHPGALEIVQRRYKELWEKGFVESAGITPAREKMAYLPEKAEALANPVGTAPAVFHQTSQAAFFALPGVPKEMQAIFEQSVFPRLKSMLGAQFYQEATVNTGMGDESVITGLVDQVMRKIPGTYLKSKATTFGKGAELEVVITAAGADKEGIKKKVQEAKKLLLALIKARPTRTAG
jgi:molybdenum cofactor synthesis domain-containing protein